MLEKFDPVDLGPKSWGTETLVAHIPDVCTGKILVMKAGASGPLQYHRTKHESFHLVSGLAQVRTRNADGVLVTLLMKPGETYRVPPGTVHQVAAIRESIFFEVSNPVFDDRVAVEG